MGVTFSNGKRSAETAAPVDQLRLGVAFAEQRAR